MVEPHPRRTGGSGTALFYQITQPVSDNSGERMGDLIVYRDVSRELEIDRMKAEVRRLRSELETTYAFSGFIGSSPGMRKVGGLMRRVVDSDVSVLVTGDSGTGKELVAKALHFNGPRRKGPFVAINCASVPETLIETEMFGHERGAFSGATARRAGCFEQADGGTLLLDEIGDMPVALQAKLLRVLQEREIRRVGGKTTIPIDVRVIASTHRDLEAAMREGVFREDLYYRLAVFPIDVPPLRTRREDIPLLAEHFRKKHAKRLGVSVRAISTAATALLARYDWPGNVRELENVICRSLVLETSDVLQAATLPAELKPPNLPHGTPDAPATLGTLADLERQAIADAIEKSDHNLTAPRAPLGIDRTTLHRKLKKYGLRTARPRARAPSGRRFRPSPPRAHLRWAAQGRLRAPLPGAGGVAERRAAAKHDSRRRVERNCLFWSYLHEAGAPLSKAGRRRLQRSDTCAAFALTGRKHLKNGQL